MTQREKLYAAVKTVNNETLSTFPTVTARAYTTIYSLLRSHSRETHVDYIKLCEYYNTYFVRSESNHKGYVVTMYYDPKLSNVKHKTSCFDIQAISTDPVKVALDNTQFYTVKNYVYLLLHELGHLYYSKKKSDKTNNEREVDKFAIRWYKRIYNVQII